MHTHPEDSLAAPAPSHRVLYAKGRAPPDYPEDVCHSKGSMYTHANCICLLSNRANSSERGSVLFARSRTNSSVLFARDRVNSSMLFTRDRANSNCLE